MKAEHRKELETNILADRMGHLIQKMKGGPQRRSIVYVVVALLLCGVAFIVYQYWTSDTGDTLRWVLLEQGEVAELFKDSDNSNAKKAAMFEYAHIQLWNQGVRVLASHPKDALNSLDGADGMYKDLAKLCAGNKEWESEALYSQAIIEETFAAVDIKKLDSARKMFEEMADTFKDAPHKDLPYVKLAAARAKYLADNATTVKAFYQNLGQAYGLPLQDKIRRIRELEGKDMPKKK